MNKGFSPRLEKTVSLEAKSYGTGRVRVEVTVAFVGPQRIATRHPVVLVVERLRRTEAPEVSFGNSQTPTGYQGQVMAPSASAPRLG